MCLKWGWIFTKKSSKSHFLLSRLSATYRMSGCIRDLPRCRRQQGDLTPRATPGGCSWRFSTDGSGPLQAAKQARTHTPVCQVSDRWSPSSPRGCIMLTDMILEEEFDKNGESWYHPQDLENGETHPRLPDCVGWHVITVQTVTHRLQNKYGSYYYIS